MSLFFAFVIDPAGLNNKFDLGLVKDSALAHRTQKFVELNEIKPNTIILGGSRVHFLNTNDVEKYTQDKVYNVGLSQSTLEEQYCFLKYSIDNFDIKNVVIGLNLYPFSEKLKKNTDTDFDKEIFETGFSIEKQVEHYLEVPLIKYIKDYFRNDYKDALYDKGARTSYNQNLYIDNRIWGQRAADSNKMYSLFYDKFLTEGRSGINIFSDMVKLCRDNKINLKVFTTAIHQSQFELLHDVNKTDVYFKWKKEISDVVDYYDFMYPNSVTINSDNYIDPSHLRQEKGYMYFAKIFNDKTVNVPKDFGVLVTKQNIDEHLQNLREQIEFYDLNKSLKSVK